MAGAHITTGHVLTGATVHTGVGLALVVVDVAVGAAPTRIANTVVTIDFVFAVSMNARVTETLVELRLTGGVMIAVKALTGETVDSINTRSSVLTGVDGTLVDIDVTHFSCVSRLAGTLVSVDLVNALAIVTWAALTVVQIDLTVNT